MGLPLPSILSQIACHLRDLIHKEVDGKPEAIIGPPAEVEPSLTESGPVIGLFFHRFGVSGFYPDAGPHEPFHLRIHCLFTAFARTVSAPDGAQISAGETNLRLLGSLIQLFHEKPVQKIVFTRQNPTTGAEEIRTNLQIIPSPLSSEEINQIWATQGDTIYRPSIAYELALAPITPWLVKVVARPVAEDGVNVAARARLDIAVGP